MILKQSSSVCLFTKRKRQIEKELKNMWLEADELWWLRTELRLINESLVRQRVSSI